MAERRREERTYWSTTLPPVAASVPVARHFTADVLEGLATPKAAEETAALLVSELTTNAVIHACSPLRLSVYRNGDAVRVEVRDDDPTPPRSVTPDPERPGGRGILLVDALASTWGVNSNDRGKTIWFELA